MTRDKSTGEQVHEVAKADFLDSGSGIVAGHARVDCRGGGYRVVGAGTGVPGGYGFDGTRTENSGGARVGYESEVILPFGWRIRGFCREQLAKIAAFIDVLIRRRPKFLGSPVPIF